MSKRQIDRSLIEASLSKKGFVNDGGDHKYYYHEINGKRTGAYAKISRGSKYKVYPIQLIRALKSQLCLHTLQDAFNLLNCPMNGDEYIKRLKNNGII